MGRLLKFLFGLTIGAGAALLVTPKTGREVRGMLSGSQVRGLMPARLAELSRPRDYDEPEGAATAVAEPPVPAAEPKREFFVAPEPVVEAVPEPVAEAEPEPVVEAEPEPEPIAEAEPTVEAVPEPVAEPEPEPVAEAEPEPIVEAEPVFVPEPVVEAEPEPVAEAEPVVVPEPVAETEPVFVPEPVAEAEPEPVAPDEDLRARIEETKADVVREIQKPFQVAEEPTAAPALEPVTEAEPVFVPEPVAETETEPVAEPEPVAEAEPAPDHATLEANLGFAGASSALEESGERSADFAGESPGAVDIPTLMSDDSASQVDAPPADAPAVTLVPDLQAPVGDVQAAPSHDAWSADPVPASFEPELAEESPAESAPVVEPVVAAAPEVPATSEAPVAVGPADLAVVPAEAEPVVAEAPVVLVEPVVAAAPEVPATSEAPVAVGPADLAVVPAEAEPVVPAEPVVDETPVAVEPLVADASAPEEPADEAPQGNIDQAEMRRRIEETRARLKAKAFDAMMSGEAALLARDSGEKPVPRGDGVPVDHDVAETLDESLSQDDD